jgi:hypothetical protein
LSILLSAALAAELAAPVRAQAQGTHSSFGVRGGVTADPKQVFAGAHFETPRFAPHLNLTCRPNVELGFGNGSQRVSGNLEFAYWVRLGSTKWSGYIAAGPTASYMRSGSPPPCAFPGCATVGRANGVRGSFNGGVGFQHDSGLFFEVKKGAGFNPSLSATVGLVLKKRP